MKTSMTRIGVFFGVCMALVACDVTALGAETGDAKGKVIDLATNAGVADVKVTATTSVEFEEDKQYATVTTTTAKDGTYTLKKLLATIPLQVQYTYALSFEKVGYVIATLRVSDFVAEKTKLLSDVALCPIPVNHGVYRITDETAQFLQRFMRDSSVRPEHPLTYTPLPQATYKKTPIPDKKDEFTREFTVSRGTVIPQILHKRKGATGEAFMVLFERNERAPTVWPISEDGSTPENRRFIAAPEGTITKPAFEISLVNAQCSLVYSGDGSLGLRSGFSVFFVRSGGNILAFLFEVVDTVSGDDVTRCKNILTIIRHEIAVFREQNGRWPTNVEIQKFEIYMFNPFVSMAWATANADSLNLQKGATYTDDRGVVGWLYSPSTGELWPASASGNGEAGW